MTEIMIEIKEYQAHAVLVALITPTQPEERTREYLDELAFLADTNKIVPVKRFVQRLDGPNSNTFVGEGKLQEIKDWIEERNKLYRPTPQKDMSQEELAKAVNVSRQTINAIEKGDYNPTINLCIAICKALGVTLNDLFWEN